jgi:F-type H+-transporting ATPase subunit delta
VAALMGESSPLVASFLQVLLDRGRIVELRAVAAAFAERVAEAERRVAVEAVTAIPLSPELRERIARRVADETGREVDLTETLDPDIVGGLMLRAGGVVVDGSVRQRLAGLRQALAAAPVDAAP